MHSEGVVDLAVNASDDVAVVRVEYTVDGVVVGVSSASPFSAQWDSNSTFPGAHLLSATAYDASGNRGTATPLTISVAGTPPGCGSPGWVCLPGGGPARTDCYSEWLVRSDTAVSSARQKGRAACTDGAACDGDGAVDGGCSLTLGVCFAAADDRLLDRHGVPACDTEDLSGFSLLAPGYRRTAVDATDAANVRALLMGVSALTTGLPQGRCASGAQGRECADDSGCDTSTGASDGVCGLELTSLAGLGGVEACTALQQLRVPLKGKAGAWRKGVRTFKALTRALPEGGRGKLRDADVLKLECRPAS
jgi:hypothetical protein